MQAILARAAKGACAKLPGQTANMTLR